MKEGWGVGGGRGWRKGWREGGGEGEKLLCIVAIIEKAGVH
jgi:hypothetical protein